MKKISTPAKIWNAIRTYYLIVCIICLGVGIYFKSIVIMVLSIVAFVFYGLNSNKVKVEDEKQN